MRSCAINFVNCEFCLALSSSSILLPWFMLLSSTDLTIAPRFILASLYPGFIFVLFRPLDGVLRAAARLIGGVPKFGHIVEFMSDTLHWLPVPQRILYKVTTVS